MGGSAGNLSRPDAQFHLRLYGVDPKELPDKLEQLDDSQLAFVAQNAETVKSAGILGVVAALLESLKPQRPQEPLPAGQRELLPTQKE